jgi:4-amino-4-deoxy-L-arabinose transferase-like glycosyltransferase
MALVSFLAFCVTVYATARLVGLVDPKAGVYTAVLMLCSPALLLAFRRIEFEPVLTAFCAAGCYQWVRGIWQRAPMRCLIGGVLVGLGFLTKMWLIVPYAFALIAFCVVEAASVRSSGQSAGLRKSVIIGGAGFVAAALSHLVYIAFATPTELRVWITSVYLGIFSGHGITGGKLSALSDYARHQRSTLYYPLVLYRDHFFLAPLCLFGLGELLRVPQARRNRLLAMIVGAFVALVALSVPAYKDPRYVLATTPFFYAFAGLCISALGRSPAKLRPATVSVVRFSMLLACLAFLAVLIAYLVEGSSVVSRSYVMAHGFGTMLCLLVGELWMRTRYVTRELGILAGVGLLAFAIAYPRVVTPPPYAAIADVIRPQLAHVAPAYPSFVARDCDVLQGYLDRAGVTLEDVGDNAERAIGDAHFKAFVIAPDDTSPEYRSLAQRLRTSARDLSDSVVDHAGRDDGFRVFAR